MSNLIINLPLTEPVYVFTVLIGIILLSPFLFRLFKIPDVAAFIIVGIFFGPYGFKILARDASVELLGTIGLLYLMFVAGLELEPEKLRVNRKSSILFGVFTFLFPFVLGIMVCRYLLTLNYEASILVSIMFSTHTLVAYPIVRKLGVNNDIAVVTAIGGTIITDTLVLIILSGITRTSAGGSILFQVIELIALFGLYLFIIFYSFPRIAKWFFKHVKRDRPVHFLFLLLMVGISSALAKIIGIEPIIGAFVAGLALNKIIPKNSLLMHHVDFVGNILFIPVFLIGIGMLINTKTIFSGTYLWYVSSVLIISALSGKWIAAYISQKFLHFSVKQRNLLFGLSSSHAAATIAVILIGFEKHIIDETIFNATVLIILISCLTASFVTEKYAKKIALTGISKNEIKTNRRILVPIANPATMGNLVSLANSFQLQNSIDPVYVLSIINDDQKAKENLKEIREILENSVLEFNNLNENMKVITRVDLNVSSGIIRAAREYMVADVVFGWGVKTTTSQKIFGNVFDHLFSGTLTLYACNLLNKIEEYDNAIIDFPPDIEYEPAFISIINRIARLPLKKGSNIKIQTETGNLNQKYKTLLSKRNGLKYLYEDKRFLSDLFVTGKNVLNIDFLTRKESVSYNLSHNNRIQKKLSESGECSFILIVPGFE